jgi:hypothetical protein
MAIAVENCGLHNRVALRIIMMVSCMIVMMTMTGSSIIMMVSCTLIKQDHEGKLQDLLGLGSRIMTVISSRMMMMMLDMITWTLKSRNKGEVQ